MKIKLTELCEFGAPGDVVEPDMPDIANLLIQRGVAVPHGAAGPEPAGAGEPRCGRIEPAPPKVERRTRKRADLNARR